MIKKFLAVLVFLVSSVFAQYKGEVADSLYIAQSFFNDVNVSASSLSSNEVWFGVFPKKKNRKIVRFEVKFEVPENVKIYNKKFLNGKKTVAGYNPIFAVSELTENRIVFDFNDEISRKKARYFWFHVVPYLTGQGRIKAKFNWKYDNGEKGEGELLSGKIISQKPKIKKVDYQLNGNEVKLLFELLYKYDYTASTPDEADYKLTVENISTRKQMNFSTNRLNFINDGINRKYKVNGTIRYHSNVWNVRNVTFTLPGKITKEKVMIAKTNEYGTASGNVSTAIIGFNKIAISFDARMFPADFNKYPMIFRLGLEILSFKIDKFFLTPMEVNYWTRFDGADYLTLQIRSGVLWNRFTFSGALGLGAKQNWEKNVHVTNVINLEIQSKYRLWKELNIILSALISRSSSEDNLTGIYLGLGYSLPEIFR